MNMLKETLQQLKPALLVLLFFTILTGLIYPLIDTAIAQLFFPWKANGSLIEKNDKKIGSHLIGQSFTDPHYFFSRPSATTPYPYNGESSSGSNMGPSNHDFIASIQARVENLKKSDGSNALVPVDLVTASGSGLDPEISVAAAVYQEARIAHLNHLPQKKVHQLIENLVQKRTFGVLGEARINVLQLNISLDELKYNYARQ